MALRVLPLKPEIIEHYVQAGANISSNIRGRYKNTILHRLLKHGSQLCIRKALETAAPIHFSQHVNELGETPLHCICYRDDINESVEILRLIVLRLNFYPDDTVDFRTVDEEGRNFLSFAALHGRLSYFFPILEQLPYFNSNNTLIRITCEEVSLVDWERLTPLQQSHLCLAAKMNLRTEKTQELEKMCSAGNNPDPQEVSRLIMEYADALSTRWATGFTALEHFLRQGNTECIAACLKTPTIVYYIEKWISQDDYLVLCASRCDRFPELIRPYLELAYPLKGAWEKMISSAVANGLLSTWWPHIQYLPWRRCRNFLRSYHRLYWNFDRLKCHTMGLKDSFVIGRGGQCCDENPLTASLFCTLQWVCYEEKEVLRLVKAGASIFCTALDGRGSSIAHGLFRYASPPCMSEILRRITDLSPFFQLFNRFGETPFIELCNRPDEDAAVTILSLIVEWLRNKGIDGSELFQLEDRRHHSLLSLAAKNKRLNRFFLEIKKFPSCGNTTEPIPISCLVDCDDWKKLNYFDQNRLALLAGVTVCHQSTLQLHALCLLEDSFDPIQLIALVRECADVTSIIPSMGYSVLSYLLVRNMETCVLHSLEEARYCIDYSRGSTLQHICGVVSPLVIKMYCRAVKQRLEKFPGDKLDVVQLKRIAAETGTLTYWLSALKGSKHFSDSRLSFVPCNERWLQDIIRLKKRNVEVVEGDARYCFSGNAMTRALSRIASVRQYSTPSIKKLVKAGADVSCLFQNDRGDTLFHRIVRYGTLSNVKALLSTSDPILFKSIQDDEGNTLLHEICLRENEREAVEILSAFVERLRNSAGDEIDFSAVNVWGHNFFSLAAAKNRFAVFWKVVHRIPQIQEKSVPILMNVRLSDQDRQKMNDLRRFFL